MAKKAKVVKKSEVCPECSGTGKDRRVAPDQNKTCPNCDGKGKV